MNKQIDCVLDHVQKLIGIRRETEITDGELLDRFVSRQDETAFETLVRRHGPMVLRTCRRALGNAHAAEDAFQATFLVLARKAASIRNRDSVGGWLYEVAYHLAIRARANAARRERHERRADNMPLADPGSDENREEMQAMLDEELHRLPEKYRTPLVLCYLEGKTNTQAAKELGWPAGSMSSRLARAREMLRDRLAGRGVALSTCGLATLLSENAAPASVPAALVQNTVQAAALFAAGQTSLVGLVSGKAIILAEGMLNTMITTKLKLVAALLLAVTLLGSGTSILVQQGAFAQAADPAVAAADKKADEAPPADGKKADLYGDPLPEGALARMGTLRWRHGGAVGFVGFTDGGKQLVTNSTDGLFRVWDVATGKEVRKFGRPPQQAAGVGGAIQIDANGAVMAMPVNYGPTNAVLAPDGVTLAVAGGNDTAIRLWDVSTGKELRALTPQGAANQRIYGGNMSMCFTPDSKQLATKSYDQVVRLWSVAEGKEIRQIAKQDPAKKIYFYGGQGNTTMAFSGDGKTLATLNSTVEAQRQVGMVVLWDVETSKEIRQIKAEADNFGAIGSIAYAPDGKTLAWGRYDGVVRLIDPQTGKETSKLGTPQQGIFLNTLLFAPDGKTLATRSMNNPAIQLWDMATGKEIRTLGDSVDPLKGNAFIRVANQAGNQNLAFSPDGKTLAEGLPTNTVRLWEVATGKEIVPVSGHQGGVSSMSVSPDGKTLTTFGSDNTIRQWDVATGKELRQCKLPGGSALVALSGNGKLAAVGAANNSVAIWDIDTAKELRTINIPNQQNFGNILGGQNGMAISPDGKTLAVRGYDQNIRIFETATGAEKNPLTEQVPNANPNGVVFTSAYYGGRSLMVFSPDGNVLATLGNALQAQGGAAGVIIGRPGGQAASTIVRLWNVTHGKGMGRLDIGQRGVSALAFSPDGFSIATANSDNTISLWETSTGKECLKIAIKKDEKPAVKPEPNPLEVKPAIARLPLNQQGAGSITSIAISPDGRTLAAGNIDRTLTLFDLANGKELGKFSGHQGNVLNVLFAPDSRTLLSGSADTTAMVWDGARYIKRDVPQAVDLTAAQLDELWKDLGTDGEKFYKAIGTLAGSPKQSVTLFGDRVKPAAGVDAKRIDQLVKDLDSNQFDAREKASEELEKLGEHAKPALDKILESQPALETRQRVERLIEKMVTGQAPPPDVLRTLRAVRVLQMIGTPEAKQVLDTLAKGAPGDRLTREAEAALKRLGK